MFLFGLSVARQDNGATAALGPRDSQFLSVSSQA